jgi:hypothetical protein
MSSFGGTLHTLWQWCTIDNVLRFPTQKYIVIKDRTLVRDQCTGTTFMYSVHSMPAA